MTWSAIIPSCDDQKLLACVDSLCLVQPDLESEPSRIVVVSDGLSKETRDYLYGVTWVKGKKPFVFARAINAGARAAEENDILICGDDVRFTERGQIDKLGLILDGQSAISPEVVGVCGQPAQRPGSSDPSPSWIAFVAVYIPRWAWKKVGELDERFVGYGYDDVDWCLRSREHGRLLVDHSSRVQHIDSSSWRTRSDWRSRYAENKAIFEQKWKGKEAT